MKKIKIGSKIGNLKVISEAKTRSTSKRWNCLCDCGNERTFGTNVLLTRHNTSCGCMAHQGNRSHGLTNTNFYRKWDNIIRRCYRKSYEHYHLYGGRGIKTTWKKNFVKFRDEMYESYLDHVEKHGVKNTTIERIDPNGNYCKENCRWATNEEQGNNRRTNVFVNYKNRKITITQLAKELGVYRNKIHNLLRTRSIEEIVKMIESGSIYKSSNGKKLELL